MSNEKDTSSFFARSEVRAAVALGYVGLAALIFWPSSPLSSGSQVAKSAESAAAVAPAAETKSEGSQVAKPAESAAAVAPAAPATAPAAETKSEGSSKPIAVVAGDAKPADDASPEARAAIDALAKISDYHRASWNPIHNKPDIDTATNSQCLACHKEILDAKPRDTSPAGVTAAGSEAWYQTLDTYDGPQMSFHARHLSSPYANKLMNLKCNFCHQGNDLREEAPHSSATAVAGGFTLRKMVDSSKTCLLCHGKFPGQNMGFDQQTWPELRDGMETPEAPNGCLSCHADQFRTVRHQVNYLDAAAIEEAAKTKADVCYGCHGGRAWYRISYPYPRHPWPGMDPAVPDWAKDRPVTSAPEHLTGLK